MNFSLFAALIDVFEDNSEMYTTYQRDVNVSVVSLYANPESNSTLFFPEDYWWLRDSP